MQHFSTLLMLICIISSGFAKVIEVDVQSYSNEYLDIINDSVKSPKSVSEKIRNWKKLLDSDIPPFERFDIVCWQLTDLFNQNKEYEKFLDMWKDEMSRGMFFPFQLGEHPVPEFLPEIKDTSRVNMLLLENEKLKQKSQNGNIEYFIKLPHYYNPEKRYPLLILNHGGWGSHKDLALDWHSKVLQSEFIVAFVQGSVARGSFLYSFGPKDLPEFKVVYDCIISNYSVDTTRVIIGGPSMGGLRAVDITLQDILPVTGLLLAFPVKPGVVDAGKVIDMSLRGVRAAIIAGENDWGLAGQKELAVIFDKLGVENRFVVFSGLGHGYPPNFSEQIDQSLTFILRE